MYKILFVAILSILIVNDSFAYKNKRVITLANVDSQSDSFNYNFVKEFIELIDENLKSKRITIWDSPRKETKIDYIGLQSIENSSGLKFINCQNLFSYELWSSNKHETDFEIFGFTLSAFDKKGNDVVYGYVDYYEISDLLKTSYLKAQIDGNFKTSFYHVLMNKAYSFDLIAFDDAPIVKSNSRNPDRDFQKGLKLVKKAFNESKTNLKYVTIQNSKLISYSIKRENYDLKGMEIISIVEDYFDLHKRELLSFGGESVLKSFRESPLFISEIEVNEIWIKKNGQIEYQIVQLTPVVFGYPFENPLTYDDLLKLGLTNDEEISLFELFDNKDYEFEIIEINGIEIDPLDNILYQNALKNADWNKLSSEVE